MPFAAALSRHPVATVAVGEVVGDLLERIGLGADLVVVFATGQMLGAFDDIVRAINDVLLPRHVIGCGASGVLAATEGVEDQAALTVWAARFEQRPELQPVRITDAADVIAATPASGVTHVIVLADPFSFRSDEILHALAAHRPDVRLIGGLASASNRPGGNRLVLDGRTFHDGAVAIVLPPDLPVSTVVSQGCRPVGQPFVITKAERNVLYELGGRPALERLTEMVAELNEPDRRLASQGLHCGLVVDEQREQFARGDFLIRGLLGADRSIGAIAIGDEPAVGTTVQFHVRDPDTAGDDLASLLTDERADGGLLFTCTGRGAFMFSTSNFDASIVDDTLIATGPTRPAIAGMFCAGEIGPVGSRNALHGFTASLALFRDR